MLQYHCAVQKEVNRSQIVSLPQSDRQIKTFTGVHTYIHKAYMHACMHMYAHIRICTYTHKYACSYKHLHVHVHICAHIHVHVYHSQEDIGRQSPAGLSFSRGHLTSIHPLVDPWEVIPRGCAGSKDLEEMISKMAPPIRRYGQAEWKFGPSAAVTVPAVCQQVGSPHCWKEESS